MDKSLYSIKELDLMYDTLENHLTDDYDKDLLSKIYEWHSSYETELDYENDKLRAEIEITKNTLNAYREENEKLKSELEALKIEDKELFNEETIDDVYVAMEIDKRPVIEQLNEVFNVRKDK